MKKSALSKLKETLEGLAPAELKDFILDLAKQDAGFRNNFLAKFSSPGNEPSKSDYASEIRRIIKSVTGRSGTIDYPGAAAVSVPVMKMLNEASGSIDNSAGLAAARLPGPPAAPPGSYKCDSPPR